MERNIQDDLSLCSNISGEWGIEYFTVPNPRFDAIAQYKRTEENKLKFENPVVYAPQSYDLDKAQNNHNMKFIEQARYALPYWLNKMQKVLEIVEEYKTQTKRLDTGEMELAKRLIEAVDD